MLPRRGQDRVKYHRSILQIVSLVPRPSTPPVFDRLQLRDGCDISGTTPNSHLFTPRDDYVTTGYFLACHFVAFRSRGF